MRLLGVLILVLVVGCTDTKSTPVFHADSNPTNLSDWNLFKTSSGKLQLTEGVIPYDLNSPLFTDYALKLRTIWVPKQNRGLFELSEDIGFPIGTVISKTFYYPEGSEPETVLMGQEVAGTLDPLLMKLDQVKLVETRLLVRRDSGWEAVSYVWNSTQSNAKLTKTGGVVNLSLADKELNRTNFAYLIPDINQCAGCHAPNNTSREIEPLGIRPRHFNKEFTHNGEVYSQLEHLAVLGYLYKPPSSDTVSPNVDWTNTEYSLDQRARAYLDINCSHCHNPVGPADTSGLDLTVSAIDKIDLGVCKLPIAAGAGTGGRLFSIVPGQPDASILIHRLETTDPGAMMPELGRALQHHEGVALVRAWIEEMDGEC